MSESLTLGFHVDALDVLTDPAAAFEDARGWSTYVGVVADEFGHRVVNDLRDNGIYGEDFFSRVDGPEDLGTLRARFDTGRYVIVGRDSDTLGLGDDHRWEFLTVSEAARAAGWELASDDGRSAAGGRSK